MAEPAAGANLLFLREEDIRLAQDLLMLAHRDLATITDAVLTKHQLGRAHHRVLHFIARNPGLTVGDLLALLGISKQSLSRVLGPLLRQGLAQQTPSRVDKRQRLLTLTAQGAALEREVFEAQRERLTRAYRLAGGTAVEGFKRVLRLALDEKGRAYIDRKERG